MALLAGVAAGAVMAAGAGARRTETAYQDLVEETDGLDAAVEFACNPARNPNCPSEVDEIRALPGVADAALFITPLVPVTDEDGDLVQLQGDPCYSGAGGLQPLIPQGSEFGTSMSRRRIIEGRDLDPTAADERFCSVPCWPMTRGSASATASRSSWRSRSTPRRASPSS